MASLTGVEPGDIVLVNRSGRKFYAVVNDKRAGMLTRITPITPNITYTTAKSREVEEVFRKKRVRKTSTSGHDAG